MTKEKQALGNIQVNPLEIACSAFLVLAPFLAWVSISAFGLVLSSSLWDIANSRTPLPVSSNITASSLIAVVLLIGGGLVNLRSWRLGLSIATLGLVVFLLESYTLFGARSSVIVIEALPGIGLFIAAVGIALGLLSTRVKKQPLGVLVRRLGTKAGLFAAGLSIASVSVLLDALAHTGLGQSSEFLGKGLIEGSAHAGFLLGLILLVGLFYTRKAGQVVTVIPALVMLTLVFLIFDAAYHFTTGDVSDFIGHDPVEVVLHIASYYGVAFMIIGRLILRPSP